MAAALGMFMLVWGASSLAVPNSGTLVLGGGFAGLYTTLNLARAGQPVTLVDSRERFVFSPLLYEFAAGLADEDEVSATYESLLRGTSAKFVRGEVASVDASSRVATLCDGSALCGDAALVLALGKEPVVREGASSFYRLEDATAIRAALARKPENVLIVGGGYTGVELACHVAAKLARDGTQARVLLAQRGETLVPSATPYNRGVAETALAEAGVEVLSSTSVDALERCGADDDDPASAAPIRATLRTADGAVLEEIVADLVVWTAGADVAPAMRALPRELKVFRDPRAPLRVDAALRVRGLDRVFAIGDAAAVAGVTNAPSAQMALQQAVVAARNVQAEITGAPLFAFKYVELGEMLSFGAGQGAASLLPGLELPGLEVDGQLASIARRLVYAWRMPTRPQRLTALTGLATAAKKQAAGAPSDT